MSFDYTLDFDRIDFRQRPDLYRIGRGEQGVFHVQPYKSELLPLWRFRTPEIARESADALHAAFERYRDEGDFVGMDMARKYIQMGFTRARRYANHRSGRKRDPQTGEELPLDPDPVKAGSAAIFREILDRVRADPAYIEAAARHRERYQDPGR